MTGVCGAAALAAALSGASAAAGGAARWAVLAGELAADGDPRRRLELRDGESGPREASWRAVAAGLRADAELQDLLSGVIRDSPHRAVFFETRSVRGQDADRVPFEFVVLDAPSLASRATTSDLRSFAQQVGAASPDALATEFPNLGGDARLVVPLPNRDILAQDPGAFAHLAKFMRATAQDPARSRAVWSAVGATIEDHWAARPAERMWLSTSGLGVYYLHFRIDSVPKYYTFRPFAAAPSDDDAGGGGAALSGS